MGAIPILPVEGGKAAPRVPRRVRDVARRLARSDALLGRFAAALFEKAADALVEASTPEALERLAREAFAHVRRRRPGDALVRVSDAGGGTLVATLEDVPFLLQTLREVLRRAGRPPTWVLHPLLGTERDARGRLRRIAPPDAAATREAFLLLRFDARGLDLRRLEREARAAIGTVRSAVEDFEAMRARIEDAVADLDKVAAERPGDVRRADEVGEVQAFLRWLTDGSFVFLGYRAYEIIPSRRGPAVRVVRGSGLGMLRDESRSAFRRPVPLRDLPADLRRRIEDASVLIVSKTNAETAVYRLGRMDYIGVKTLDARGRVTGERRWIGHFAHRAAFSNPRDVPILRRKFRAVLDAYRVVPGSHDAREIERLLHSLPRDTLFATPAEDLLQEVEIALETGGDEARSAFRHDPARRGTAVTVVMPRGRFAPEVRERIQRRLAAALETTATPEYHLVLDPQTDVARLHFFFPSHRRLSPAEVGRLRAEIAAAARRWEDGFAAALRARFGAAARGLAERYAAALGAAYRVLVEPDLAVADVADLEAMRAAGAEWWISFGRPTEAAGGPASVLKIYHRGSRAPLSEIVPVLADHALVVLDEVSYDLAFPDGAVFLYVLPVRGPDDRPLARPVEPALAESIGAVLAGVAEGDRMNGLIAAAGFSPREVARFRAIHGYFRQSGAVHTRRAVFGTLLAHPAAVRAIRDLWDAKFNPALGPPASPRRRRRVEAARRAALEALEGVEALDDDRILRGFLAVVEAAVRTNEYQPGAEALAFKIDCEKVPWLRRPRPWREVWVDSPSMAGCHLRFGPVARGGIRWSDRPDDFRTEVLGLARTQVVKNAQIVPTGAKGGFVVKRAAQSGRDRDAFRAAGLAAYRTLIRSLLDLTDNLVEGRVVPPPSVVRHDGDDAYLVVAADKGTATFSDVANEIAAERGFWLGDAFASGGSRGYDHKKEAITARGAWACVRRHLREAGRDPDGPITVVGIGDMSGDVFGNGLLLMRRARLVAAFDHRHVFVDPDPDPERAWRERRRLFRLPGSSWADYDRRVISRGGGVWGRTEKSIRLPAEARRVLSLGAGPVDGEAVVRAILAAEVDLLWNGGIGTYVKATDETHAEVGDPANDGVRIDASALRIAVVGEGGNLGFTPRARIEAARRGVRLNTDAIDNAGGVHLSDKEVNLKILLAGRRGRDRILSRVKDEVIEQVLEAQRDQSLAISMDVARSVDDLGDFAGLMLDLERKGLLNRRAERLPDAEEVADRRRAGEGLTRPEAAVLLAYAKIDAVRRILESPLLTRPAMDRFAAAYFPAAAVQAAGGRVDRHPLRDRILATVIANRFVNHHGAAALWRLTQDLGLAASRVIEASIRAEEIVGALDLRRDLRAVEEGGRGPAEGGRGDGRPAAERPYADLFDLEETVLRATRWVVRHGAATRDFDRLDRRFLGVARRLLPANERERFEADLAAARRRGAPEDLAARLASLRHLRTFLDVVDVARKHRAGLVETGRLLYEVGARLEYPTILDLLEAAPRAGEWDRAAAANVVSDLRRARRLIAERVIADYGGDVEKYLELRFRSLDSVRAMAARIAAEPSAGLTPFVVFSDQVNNLAAL